MSKKQAVTKLFIFCGAAVKANQVVVTAQAKDQTLTFEGDRVLVSVGRRPCTAGLGLEAQREAVLAYLNGSNWSIAAEFTEVESGKRSDRPEFAKALAACRLHRATLVIAKLDRLARAAALTSLFATGSVR